MTSWGKSLLGCYCWIYAFSYVNYVTFFAAASVASPSCLDEEGQPVDSWVAFSQNEAYQYYWHDDNLGFVKSPYRTNQTTEGGIMRTVNQLYNSSLNMSNIAYALYNDDPPGPDTASSSYAHSKGMVLVNDEAGFWLIHSKPNWPNSRADNATVFPDTQYSQSLMCITINTSSFETIAEHSMVNHPYLYDSFISNNLAIQFPLLNEWVTENDKSDFINLTSSITSNGGIKYTLYAKAKAWGKDLYDDLVAPSLEEPLYVETWRNGAGGRMGSNCQDDNDDTWEQHPLEYDILQVDSVTMPDGATWLGTQDHSKWASTIGGSTICVADINRMCSQENRGGGAACVHTNLTSDEKSKSTPEAVQNVENLWYSFNKSVSTVEECWEYDPCAGTSTQCYWCPSDEPTVLPTAAPSVEKFPSISAVPTVYKDKSVAVGDIAVVLYNTDNPDSFSLVAMKDIASGVEILVTDDGWYESTQSFRGSEGVLGFSVRNDIPAGTTWYYDAGSGMSNAYGSWSTVSGSFALSSAGDSILVYLLDEDNSDIAFIYGLSTIPWVTDLTTTLTSSTSNLPSTLQSRNASVFFDSSEDNGYYEGSTEGFADDLLLSISNSSNWVLSNSLTFAPQTTLNTSFTIFALSSFPSSQPSSEPSWLPSVVPSRDTTYSPTSSAPKTTLVSFSTLAQLGSLTANDMDLPAQDAFIEVTADAMTGVSSSDLAITSMTTVVSAMSVQSGVLRESSSNAVDITFVTTANLEESGFSSTSELVQSLNAEVTAAYSDPSTATTFTTTAEELGSTTVNSSTVVVFEEPEVDVSSITVEVIRTYSPTATSATSDDDDNSNIIIFIVVPGCILLCFALGFIYFRCVHQSQPKPIPPSIHTTNPIAPSDDSGEKERPLSAALLSYKIGNPGSNSSLQSSERPSMESAYTDCDGEL